MNSAAMERCLDVIEENLGRLIHLLPDEEVLKAYLRLRPDLDPLTIANLFGPIVERGIEARGMDISIEGVRRYLAAIQTNPVGKPSAEDAVTPTEDWGSILDVRRVRAAVTDDSR